jgi:DNA invertase Pin-like site-specific DNA recombinase
MCRDGHPGSCDEGNQVRKVIAYYRVSTKQQGESGLGLEAQVSACNQYRAGQGVELVRAYQEVESGKRSDRPELAKALAHAKRAGATLVIAKLDRLARNVLFTARLMESGVDFIACDNPHANKLTIHILAAVAEDEARRISQRTKDALAAYKARGGKLGAAREGAKRLTPELGAKGCRASAKVRREKAAEAYSDLAPIVRQLRAEGLSLRAIADRLTEDGHATRRGRPWNAMQVHRLLSRA